MTDRRAIITSRQVTARLLCGDCEDRFSRNGETWVIGHCDSGKEGFKLQDLLQSVPPLAQLDNGAAYAAAAVPQIQVDKLAYFSLSVVWRASAHKWRAFGGTVGTTDLGPYEEQLRLFLLDEKGFPAKCAMAITVSLAKEKLPTAYAPTTTRLSDCHRHSFLIPGIKFDIFLGGQMRPRPACFFRSPQHVIFGAKDFNDKVIEAGTRTLARSKVVGKLAKRQSP